MNINVIASKEDFDDMMSFRKIMSNYKQFIKHNDKIENDSINLIIGCKLFDKYNLEIDYHENNIITIPNRKEEISKFVKGLNIVKRDYNIFLTKQVTYKNLDVNVNSKTEINEKISLCTDKSFVKYEIDGISYYYGCDIIFGLNDDYFDDTKEDYDKLKVYLDKKVKVELNKEYNPVINEFLLGVINNKKYIPYIYSLLNEKLQLVS